MLTSPARTTTVYVVDDHQLACEGLRRILSGPADLEVIGAACSAAEALAQLARRPADVVVLDGDLGTEPSGAELCRQLTGPGFGLTCLGLLPVPHALRLRELLAAGARGVLLKGASSSHIVDAVRAVARDGNYLDPQLTPLLMEAMSPSAPLLMALSPPEQAVLSAMSEGQSNHEIADRLCMSLGAVKGHVSHLLSKLQASSRTEAVAIAARSGLLPVGPR